MKLSAFAVIIPLVVLFLVAFLGSEPIPNAADVALAKTRLKAFASEQELKRYLTELARNRKHAGGGGGGGGAEEKQAVLTDQVPVSLEASDYSITNVQHAGVDEGGIVKVHGDHLVILRRGRLFTIAIGGDQLKPVSTVDAFGPGIDPDDAWYDEMLVSGDHVVVVGYSYERGGTEVGIFGIDTAGQLKYRSTYHLRSNDYYSAENYTSRLIGSRLVFYSPLHLRLYEPNALMESLPAMRKWHKGAKDDEFRVLVSPTRMYRSPQPIGPNDPITLHTITSCEIGQDDLTCEATAVIGESENVFYVSNSSVYVWASAWFETGKPSTLYRMPLDGSAPSALLAEGRPVNQFSFLEDEGGYLNVVVESNRRGDTSSSDRPDVALMRVQVDSFSDGSEAVPTSRYRQLPKPRGYMIQNRFVGDHLLYGMGSDWVTEDATSTTLYVTRRDSDEVTELPLPHGTDRIEALGPDAMAIGTDSEDLFFSSVRLGKRPQVVARYQLASVTQGESRSHGFFYREQDQGRGVLGLPIAKTVWDAHGTILEDSASVVFVNNIGLRLAEAGKLNASKGRAENDACRTSCVDWYGNARPIFIRGRIFALLGYEIVEGRIDGGRMSEVGRVSFAPATK